MTRQQERNLRKLVRELLAHTPDDFDMGTCHACALPVARRLFGYPAGSGRLRVILGLPNDYDARDYLFSIGEDNYYNEPKGRAAAEEFAERAETVIQYYRSIRGAA